MDGRVLSQILFLCRGVLRSISHTISATCLACARSGSIQRRSRRSDHNYKELLNALALKDSPDLCIYFVGIGLFLDVNDMTDEARVIDVNLTAMVKTASVVVPLMVKRGRGHFIGISSFADELTSAEAPSYFASKAGFSSYLRGLGLAVRPKGIHVTNIRFGFVDTKMAKGDFRALMMPVEKAVDHVQHCIDKKPAGIPHREWRSR
jgi:short-subunit dehydrogenase